MAQLPKSIQPRGCIKARTCLVLMLFALLSSKALPQAPTPEPTGAPGASRNDPSHMTVEISRTTEGRLKTWCIVVVVPVCETLGPQTESDPSKPLELTPELAALTPAEVFAKAQALERAGNLAEAKQYYEHYLKVAPKGPLSKDSKRGVARINPHLEMRAFNPRLEGATKEVEIGDSYAEKKDFDSALDHYLHALHIHRTNGDALFRMAGVLETIEQYSEAREYYAAYLKHHPQGKFADACKRALARLPADTAPPTSAPAETPQSKR